MSAILFNTERTLSADKPCPRAVLMPEQRISGGMSFHKNWDGFYICSDGYLWTPRGKRYQPDYINKIEFLQRAARYNESHVNALQHKIDHFHELVAASDTLKAIDNDLIKMSDDFALKDIMLKY
ncbi:DUF3653 domain-containing protein, partial [Pseudoalteromonas sp. BSi20652]|uniref:DUF3653 domain-containing protein n=1 Tax=Pseudoalteromonas sp. BSi20652 TaxID=388384 RepID=UPI001ED8F74A